jgi:hypothetical protein
VLSHRASEFFDGDGDDSAESSDEPQQPLMLELDPDRASGCHHVAALVDERTSRPCRSTVAFEDPPDHNEPFSEKHVAVAVCRQGAEKTEPTAPQ